MSNHLIFVTCTYQRPQRIAFLRRHIDTIFSKIDNYTWIIVEDGAVLDPEVSILTAGLNVIYLNVGPTKDKGNVQRNLALETIRDRRIDGVVYNMDDDNLVYELFCKELRKVSRFSIFPVGNLAPDKIERPVLDGSKFIGWMCGWHERQFPIDMGGFAFPSRVLFDLPSPIWMHKGIGGESEFLARFAKTVEDLDLSLCHYNKMCLVYHNEPLDSPVRVG